MTSWLKIVILFLLVVLDAYKGATYSMATQGGAVGWEEGEEAQKVEAGEKEGEKVCDPFEVGACISVTQEQEADDEEEDEDNPESNKYLNKFMNKDSKVQSSNVSQMYQMGNNF